MKRTLIALLAIVWTGVSFAESLQDRSFLSFSKGECTIANSRSFAPEIQSFRLLYSFKELASVGDAFIYYNMLGTSVGLMTPARFYTDRSGVKTVTGKLLIGLANGPEADVVFTASGTQMGSGTVAISQAGRPIFSSTYSCTL